MVSAIVDLCLALAASNPYNRVESILMNHGIQVDKCTVKNYCLKFREKAKKFAGIPVMDDSRLEVNILKILFDVENVDELKKKYPNAKYDSSMDETYPRVKGAKKEMAEEEEEKRYSRRRFPSSFTLALSYMNHLGCTASLSCRSAPSNSIVAEGFCAR